MSEAQPRTLPLALLLAVALLVAGCGSSGTSDADREALDQANAALDQAEALGIGDLEEILSDDEAACVEDGIDPDDVEAMLTDAGDAGIEAGVAVYTTLLDCVEDPVDNPEFVSTIMTSFGASLGSVDLSADEERCVFAYVLDNSEDPARTLIGAADQAAIDLILDAADACVTQENLDVLYGVEGAGPQAYGDDERLDGMHDDCLDGDERACDLLYLLTSTGSEYEEVGSTCGGRQPAADAYCTPGLEITDDGTVTPGSPVLGELAADCEEGDLTACDLLRQVAPLGSDLENTGFTCGGRIAVGAVPDCRTRLGG